MWKVKYWKLGESIKEYLYDFGIGKYYLNKTEKANALSIYQKIDNFYYINII